MSKILQWASKDGEFRRQVSSFRHTIAKGTRFEPAKNRYHLYVSLACPWAHRTLIVRKLKKLEDIISVSVVDYEMGPDGWHFSDRPGCSPCPYGSKLIRELYFKAEPEYNARFTVPVLWDLETQTIVNNESSEIIRIFNDAFDEFVPKRTFYPEELRGEIDAINEWIYNDINNGVYRSGFATAQEPYEKAVTQLFKSLDRVEAILSKQEFLLSQFTEADIRLFTTIVRFDPVYHTHFKCNLKTLQDYPSILRWLKQVYQMEGIKETVNMEHIKKHYYLSHKQINPFGIVPVNNGPDLE